MPIRWRPPSKGAMPENLIVSTPEAYSYPLLIKQLLTNSLSLYGDQEITYRGELRYTFRDFRTANRPTRLGARESRRRPRDDRRQ